MDQLEFEAQADIGECPTCAIQKRIDKSIQDAHRAKEHDQGKKL